MKYYTIQNDMLLTADFERALTRFYDKVLPLPYDYEEGKYIVINGELALNPDWDEEQAEKEAKRIANLNLTKADFWIALLDREITKDMVKEKIALIPDEKLKAKTLIRIDEADHFWRGDAAMDVIGAMFDLTPEDLTYLFENKELPPVEKEDEIL